MTRHVLDITTSTGQKKIIIPASVSSIRAWTGGGDIALVCHGSDDYEVRLDPDECRQFINVASSDVRSKCPHYRGNACWFARQMYAQDAPPVKCIKCQLTKIYMEARLGDLRLLPQVKPRSPLYVAFWGAMGLMAFSWLGVQDHNKLSAENERLRQEIATFKRQGEKRH